MTFDIKHINPFTLRLKLSLLFAVLLIGIAPSSGLAQNDEQRKLAQTGFKFLSVSVDPRAASLGNAVTALDGNSASLFYNPASMASQTSFVSVAFGQLQYIADIQHSQASISIRPANGRFGVFGFSLRTADYGELQETIRADNDAGYLDIGTFSPSALSLGFGYAKRLSDRFSVGGQVKWAYQNLGASIMSAGETAGTYTRQENEASTYAVDFGFFYRTGWKSLNFAVSARNFSAEVTYETEGFQLPLTVQIGVGMNLMDLFVDEGAKTQHAVQLSIDAEHARDYDEQIHVGLEYTFMDLLSIRSGYAFPADAQGVSFGGGVHHAFGKFKFAADYAYTDFGDFNSFNKVHQVAFQFSY